MSIEPNSSPWDKPELSDRRAIDQLCRTFEEHWRTGNPTSIETTVACAPQNLRTALLPELIAVEWEWRTRSGNNPTQEEYRTRFPEQELLLNELASDPKEDSPSLSALPSSISLQAGDVFAGYRILRTLGVGGMGTVFLAEIAAISHPVALKILQPSHEQNGPMAARFEREARLLSRLDHPGIVPLYSYGEEDGQRYLVMKAIQGVSLADIIFGDAPAGAVADNLRNRNASERWQHIRSIAIQLAEMLSFVHQAGILHRDVKPSNILLMESGKAFLSDFGLARASLIDSDLTRQHEFIGTLRYAAPESLDGVWTAQTDLYSLGLVLLELYSLNPSFPARSRRELLHQKLDARSLQKTIAACSIPVRLRRIIEKLAMFNPEHRYASAAEVLADLKKLECEEPRKTQRRGGRFVASAAFTMALAGLAAFWNNHKNGRPEFSASDLPNAPHSSSPPELTSSAESAGEKISSVLKIRDTYVFPVRLRDRANLLTISDNGDTILLSAAGELLRWDTRFATAYPIQDRPNGKVLVADISPDGDIVFCTEEPAIVGPDSKQNQEKSYGMASSMPEEAEKWFGFRIPGYDASFCVPKFVRGGPATPRCTVLVPSSLQPAMHNLLSANVEILQFPGRGLKMAAAWEKTLAVVTSDDMLILTTLEAPDWNLPSFPTEVSSPSAVQFVNDGQHLLVSSKEEFCLFSVATRERGMTQKIPTGTQPVLSTPHQGPWIAFTGPKIVHVFDIGTNQWLTETIETSDKILLAETIAEERIVITVEEPGRIRLTGIQSGARRLHDELITPPLTLAAYSVRSRRVAAIDTEANLRVFQIGKN